MRKGVAAFTNEDFSRLRHDGDSHDDASAVDASLLPQVPVTPSDHEGHWHIVALTPEGLTTAPTRGVEGGGIAIREDQSIAVPEDTLFHLYAALERQMPSMGVVGVTSAVRGEGKTTIAFNLALTAARSSGRRVCIVDLSLGDDAICRRVGAAPAPGGIISYLENTGPLSLLEWPGPESLTLLPAGKAPVNAARIARAPLHGLFAALCSAYDLVVVDLPAVATDDVGPMLPYLDGCVLVARAAATPRAVIQSAIEKIGREKILGTVLNRIVDRKRGKGFRERFR